MDMASTHINLQEGYALQQTLKMYCADHSAQIAGSTLVSDIDNKAFHDSFKRGRAKNTPMHGMIVDLFWLQVEHDFILKLRWVSSKANQGLVQMTMFEQTRQCLERFTHGQEVSTWI